MRLPAVRCSQALCSGRGGGGQAPGGRPGPSPAFAAAAAGPAARGSAPTAHRAPLASPTWWGQGCGRPAGRRKDVGQGASASAGVGRRVGRVGGSCAEDAFPGRRGPAPQTPQPRGQRTGPRGGLSSAPSEQAPRHPLPRHPGSRTGGGEGAPANLEPRELCGGPTCHGMGATLLLPHQPPTQAGGPASGRSAAGSGGGAERAEAALREGPRLGNTCQGRDCGSEPKTRERGGSPRFPGPRAAWRGERCGREKSCPPPPLPAHGKDAAVQGAAHGRG